MTVNPNELRRLLEKVSEQTEELTEKQKIMTETITGIILLEKQIIFYRRQARVKTEESEYHDFIKKYNITDINDIRTWPEEKYNNLMEKLTEINEDGSHADEEIKNTREEREILPLLDIIREGIIADIFL